MKTSLSFFTVSLALLSSGAFSQKVTGVVKGRIVAADGNPAISVSVELKKLKRLAITNENGFFILQHLPAFQDSLVVSSVGAEIYGTEIKLNSGEVRDLGTVTLSKSIKQLQQVEITGRIANSYKSDYSFLGTKTQTSLIDIPQSISSVTKELIQDKMDFTLKDAVTDVAGVNQYSGYDEYTIRGFRAENPRNINGLRGYNTTYTSPMLVNVERIEVIKGPVATLYGNSDPGGTINLVTKKPLEKNAAEINIGGGSWDHFRAMGDITGPLNDSKTFLYRLNAGYDQTHSFRNQYHAKSYQVAPSFSFIPNDRIQFNFDFSLSHINTVLDRGQPGLSNNDDLKATPIHLMSSQQGDYLKQTSVASVASLSYKINKHVTFNSGYLNYITQQDVGDHGVKDYITEDSVYLYYTQWNYHTVTNTLTNYFNFQFTTGKVSHQLIVGYDYIKSKVKLNQWNGELPGQFGDGSGIVCTFSLTNPQYIPRAVNTYAHADDVDDEHEVDPDIYHTHGIYLQEQFSYKRWKILAGIREEFYRGDNAQNSAGIFRQNVFLPRLGLVYEINSNFSLYGTYNKGFDPFEAATSFQIFKEPFRPITSQLFEVGAKANLIRDKLFASLSFYQLKLQNVAVNANDPSNPDLYVQRGEDRSRGIELEANGNVLSNLAVNFSYAYNVTKIIKSEVHDGVGMIRENAPKHSSSSWIKYTFTKSVLKRFSLAVGHSQASIRNTLDAGLRLPGYFILNAGVLYTFKKFTFALNVNNLTNETYWMGAYNNINKWPGAPRNVMFNFGYKL